MNNPISQEVSSQIAALYRAVISDDESKGYHDACKKYRDEVAAYAAKQDPTADEKEEFYKKYLKKGFKIVVSEKDGAKIFQMELNISK